MPSLLRRELRKSQSFRGKMQLELPVWQLSIELSGKVIAQGFDLAR
jgi:hypothetical protein